MPFVLRPPGEPPPLTTRLADLGRARRAARVSSGAMRLVALAAAAVGAACALDVAFHLPALLRAGLLVGTLTALGVAYRRGVSRPARESIHPLSVALRLEETFPRLNDSLASAVEFLTADGHDDRHGSVRFREVAVTRAGNLADRFDLGRIVPAGAAWRAFWLAVLACAVVGSVALANLSRAGVALVRFFDPFGRHPWPTATAIDLLRPEAFPARAAKGETFDLRFRVRGLIPERAVVHVRLSGGAATEDQIPLAVADPHGEAVAAELRLDPGRVPRDFEVRITAHDADTGWLTVTVAPPPTLIPLGDRPSPQIRIEYPAYTELSPVELPDGTGAIEAVTGTRVKLRAAADRPIRSAVIAPEFDLSPYRASVAVAGLIGPDPLTAVSAYQLAAEATAEIPVRVSHPERTLLEADFTPRLPGLYGFRFTDETGLSGKRLLDLRIFPDPAPVVALTDEAGRPRSPLVLLPTASFPLRAFAEDRTFAVKDLVLEYRIGDADNPFRSLPLVDLPAVAATLPALTGPAIGSPRVKPTSVGAARPISLAEFVAADGSAPADGDVITLRAAATDWDDLAWTKPPGRSPEVEIRVVSKPGLEALIQDELAKLRPELLQARQEQRAAREAVAEVARAAADGQPMPDEAEKLNRAEQVQREIGQRIADPADGLRARAERLRQAARTNAVAKSAVVDRAEAVADDLARLAAGRLEAAEPAVAAARREATAPNPDPKKLAEAAARAADEQQAVESALDAVLERLELWGGAGEIRGQARGLKDQLNRVGQEAAKAADRVTPGRAPDELSPRDRQEIEGPAGKLDALARQADELLGKAGRMAAEKEQLAEAMADTAAEMGRQAEELAGSAEGQPAGSDVAQALREGADKLRAEAAALREAADATRAEADALRQAVREAGGKGLPEDLRAAASALRQNQPGNSAAGRRAAAERLDRLTEALGERRRDEAADELRKRRRSAAADINELAETQDELQKKARTAAEMPEPDQREEEFQKLAREQEQLRRQAEQLAERLSRDREAQPARAVRQAADRMAQARDDLERGQTPAETQDQALDRLAEALDDLESRDKRDEEKLSRERREELTERLKALRDRQAAAFAEAGRLHEAVAQGRGWSRGQLRSYADLEPVQKALADELRGFTDQQLGELPVFRRLATQAAAAMDRAARKVAERLDDAIPDEPFDPELEAAADERVGGPMRLALRRLDQILEAVANEGQSPEQQTAAGAGEGGGADAGEGGGADDMPAGVPPLAQLKALRAVQAEVNERTAAFAKAHPDPAMLSDDHREDLRDIEQTQREIAELFDELAPAFRPAGGE